MYKDLWGNIVHDAKDYAKLINDEIESQKFHTISPLSLIHI